ncbi:MAG: hypothetical protein A2V77_10435 [Anaeromyxobacter sp. RBG_16_69_14]|nr:MAG: hypothetical protein A2V77_10435 [Anaeromyxobacter sp. RBG_16_69_14]
MTFTATLTGLDATIDWSLGTGNLGSLSAATGTTTDYTPPPEFDPGNTTAVLTATAGSLSASVTITLTEKGTAPTSLTVTPGAQAVPAGGNKVTFTATLTGSDATIDWSLGAGNLGSLSAATGTTTDYTPPPAFDSGNAIATLTATAGSLKASAIITITPAIGGTVSGLVGTGLVLQNNGQDDLAVPANATSFRFAAAVASNGTYRVTVLTQPSLPSQRCTVTNGAGTVGSTDVTNVAVTCRLPVPRFAYVANYSDDNVSAYRIEADGALLSLGQPIAAGDGPYSVAVDPAGKFAYVANSLSNDVSMYRITSTGGLELVGTVQAGPAPLSVAVDPTGNFAYVANSAVFVATTGSVSAYRIEADGALTSVGPAIDAESGPDSVAVDPTGRFVYVVNGGSSSVSAYTIDRDSGSLASIGRFLTGSTAYSVAADPTGKFVYVANRSDPGTVWAYAIAASTGALEPVGPSEGYPAGRLPSSIVVDPTGRFAYVANQGDNNVSGYVINATTGELSLFGSFDDAGSNPRSVAVDPGGKFVYVANSGGDVSAFTLDGGTGALAPVSGSRFPAGSGPNSIAISGEFQ